MQNLAEPKVALQLLQHQSRRLQGSGFRREWRQTCSNQVCIHKHGTTSLVGQELAGERGLASAVGPGDYDHAQWVAHVTAFKKF